MFQFVLALTIRSTHLHRSMQLLQNRVILCSVAVAVDTRIGRELYNQFFGCVVLLPLVLMIFGMVVIAMVIRIRLSVYLKESRGPRTAAFPCVTPRDNVHPVGLEKASPGCVCFRREALSTLVVKDFNTPRSLCGFLLFVPSALRLAGHWRLAVPPH